MAQLEEQVSNKQVLAARHITGIPKQSDMYLRSSTIGLQLPPEVSNAVLVKNLYLSCDPYMRGIKMDTNRLFYTFSPDSVSTCICDHAIFVWSVFISSNWSTIYVIVNICVRIFL